MSTRACLHAGQLIASRHADGGMRRMTDRGRVDSLEALRRELLEHEARLKSLVEQLLERERLREPSASTVRQTPAATADDQIPLTEREAQVLQLLVKGRTNRQIGAELHLVGSTVRSCLRPIYKKLGVVTRTHAAIRALELGLVTRVGPDRDCGRERRPRARSPPVATTGLVSASQP